VFDEVVDGVIKDVCLDIEKRYQLKFMEIGTDKDHVHFLVQSVPTYSVTKIVTMLKSLTAREVFKRCPVVKKSLWGGEFWSDGYFATTVGKHGNENTISEYVKKQGNKYHKLGGGPQNLDSVLSSDSYPARRIRDEQETQKAQCPIQG
jgi:REP element-mobilizing transposase RayT